MKRKIIKETIINDIYINLMPQKVKKKDIRKVVNSFLSILKQYILGGYQIELRNFVVIKTKMRKIRDKISGSWIEKPITKFKIKKTP